MSAPYTCPLCDADLTGEPIPEEHRESYGNATHFSRCIEMYDLTRDRTTRFRCPDCGGTWTR